MKTKQEIEQTDFYKQRDTLQSIIAQKEVEFECLQKEIEGKKDERLEITDQIDGLNQDLMWKMKFLYNSERAGGFF